MMSSAQPPEVEIVQDGYTVIRGTGEIDFSNVSSFQDALTQSVESSPGGFIIDLSGTTYFDSSGVAAMIAAYQDICPDGRLALVVTNPNVRDLLSLIHPEHLPGMSICDDVESAKGYIQAGRD